MDSIRLEDWAVMNADNDPYTAPELQKKYLKGTVYGHPDHFDGKPIQTSRIVSSEGRYVTTNSGTTYLLCTPHEKYEAWVLKHTGKGIDWDHPVKITE